MNPVVLIGSAIILVIVGMMVMLLRGNTEAQRKRNLSVIKGAAQQEKKKDAKDDQNKRRAEIARKLKEQGDGDDLKRRKSSMATQLEMAGIRMKPRMFLLVFFGVSVLYVVICLLLFKWSPVVAILNGVIFFFGGQRMFIGRKIKKRQKKFLMEFADALEAMVRLLKAGMPVSEAIKMSSKEFEGPVGEEMSRIYDAQRIGVSLADAVLESARRMPLTEMQMFATGISIQAQTGASLSDVLMNLAGVIRARFKLKRKIQALSSEAKASASIIGSLPFLVGGGMFLINPGFIEPLITTTIGNILLGASAFWMLTGVMVMKMMINFRI
jgi:tight adherence protein B